jgi:hypothetical protein
MKSMLIMLAVGASACPGIRHTGQEPDRNANADECFSWCDWNMKRCSNECIVKHHDPDECIKLRCEQDSDPDIGKLACKNRCGSRFGSLQNMPVRMR